jgi:hypothetical protein
MGELSPQVNVLSIALRSTVVQIPFIGPVIYEILGETLPNYKLDRITHFLEELDARVRAIEDGTMLHRMWAPIFADLVEDGIRLAARSPSRIRQDHIATLIADGLSTDTQRAISRQYLLKLLEELNDAEVVLLIAASKRGSDFDDLWRRHEATLAGPFVESGTADAPIDEAALHHSYYGHLERLQLLRPREDAANTRWGDQPVHRELTPLGVMLVRSIGELQNVSGDLETVAQMDEASARAFWNEVVPVLHETARRSQEVASSDKIVRFWAKDISFGAKVEAAGIDRVQVQGFLHPHDRWIWVESAGAKLLIRIGRDRAGVYWEHEGKRRSSTADLARLILGPVLTAMRYRAG